MTQPLGETPGRSAPHRACGLLFRGGVWPDRAHRSPLPLVLGAIVAALLLQTTADPDLWGHLTFGRLTLTGGLARTDPFSFTAPGAPWLNHEWLSEVLSFVAFGVFGPRGLVLFKVALAGATLAVVSLAVRDLGGDARARATVAVLVTIGSFPWFVTVRPQLFTFVAFALCMLALVRADRGDRRLLWTLPAIVAVWSNLHGGVVAGVGVVGCWGALRLLQVAARAAGRAPDRRWVRGAPGAAGARAIAIVGLLLVPAVLATPYGVGLWRFFAETLSVPRTDIGEWQPVSVADLGDVLGVVALLTLWGFQARTTAVRDPVHLLLGVLLAAAALHTRRHLPLALVGTGVLLAPAVVRALGTSTVRWGRGPVVAVVAAALAVLGTGLTRAGCVRVEAGTVPRTAVAYLHDAGVHGNLAVGFDWGEYAIFHLAPQLKVSIDGRRETVYSPARLTAHAAFVYGYHDWRRMLDQDHADLALVSPRFAVYGLLERAPDWRLAYADSTSGLFVRRDTAADATLAATPPPPPTPEDGECLGRDG